MDQGDLLRLIVEALEDLQVPYMVVGSIASGAYGEPRMTQDIDIVVDLRSGNVEGLCRRFASPDFHVEPDAVRQAIRTRGQCNIIHGASGNKVDLILLKDTAWNARQFERRQRLEIIKGRQTCIATPEDIILSKMLWYKEGGSEKHLRDVAGILKVSGDAVDRQYVSLWAGKMGLADIWQSILRRLGLQASQE